MIPSILTLLDIEASRSCSWVLDSKFWNPERHRFTYFAKRLEHWRNPFAIQFAQGFALAHQI